MPGYQFRVSVTLKNESQGDLTVFIPRGTVIEPESTRLSFQSAVVSHDYTFQLHPKEERSVLLEVDCWNRHLAPPSGVPGKLTPLSGRIEKTMDVWKVSDSPTQNMTLSKPSQSSKMFSALVSTSPQTAVEFLWSVLDEALSGGISPVRLRDMRNELSSMRNGRKNISAASLVSIAQEPGVITYVTPTKLRAFFIRNGGPTDENIEVVDKLLSNLYAFHNHSLVGQLYNRRVELGDLREKARNTLEGSEKKDLTDVMRRKFLDIVDQFPLLDQVA